MDSLFDRHYKELGVMLVLAYITWTDSCGYSGAIFFLLLLMLWTMAYLSVVIFLHFDESAEVNFY